MEKFWGFAPVETEGQVLVFYDDPSDWETFAPMALELRRLGVPVWYDYGLKAGSKSWANQIAEHIRGASAVVLYISDIDGMFCDEASFAMWQYNVARRMGKPVIPVLWGYPVDTDAFVKEWSEEYPAEFQKHFDAFKSLNRLDYVSYLPEDSPQNVAAKLEKLLREKDLYIPLSFDDAPGMLPSKANAAALQRDGTAVLSALSGLFGKSDVLTYSERRELRAAKRVERRYSTVSHRRTEHRVGLILGLAALLALFCFNSPIRESFLDLYGSLTHKSDRQTDAVEYTKEQLDEALGIFRPIYIYSDDGQILSEAVGSYIVTVDHYGFFKNNNGVICLALVLDYSCTEDTPQKATIIPNAMQDGEELYLMLREYAELSQHIQPETRVFVFYGVDPDGVDIEVTLQYLADGLQDECTFVCPVSDEAVSGADAVCE